MLLKSYEHASSNQDFKETQEATVYLWFIEHDLMSQKYTAMIFTHSETVLWWKEIFFLPHPVLESSIRATLFNKHPVSLILYKWRQQYMYANRSTDFVLEH